MIALRESFTEEAMLIRFVVENVLSFDERKEFQMIPQKLKKKMHHIYKNKGQDLLKMSSIYGANGSGKSNLVESISLLQSLVANTTNAFKVQEHIFKFHKKADKKQILAIEFIQNDTPYYYGLEIKEGVIAKEELYISGLGKKKDELVYERETNDSLKTSIRFTDQFESQEKNQMLKDLIISEFAKPEETIISILKNREHELLNNVKEAFSWFSETLLILFPDSKLSLTTIFSKNDPQLISELESVISNLNFGIKSLSSEKLSLTEYLGKNDEHLQEVITSRVDKSPEKSTRFRDKNVEITVFKEKDEYYVIKPVFKHIGKSGKEVDFDLSEESDGTIRIIDLIPAFKLASQNKNVIIIDEIERSIHPNLIKELVKEFAKEKTTKGQLIFTTHESNLLDQDKIFRRDEIWFTEKDYDGSTDVYSLSDFKEHSTKNIRNGYLCGRYGSIPFLSNLQDLGWLNNDNK
jgi:AAA15 family ATPase/GTPase